MKVVSATIILLVCGVTSNNVFTSVKSIQNCLTGFHRHRAAIRNVLDKGLQDGTIYDKDDKQEIETVFQDLDKCDPVTMGHPVNALRAIRRLKTLRSLLKTCEGKMDMLSDYVATLPYHTDEHGALNALVRLQKSYDLHPHDIIRGNLRGVHATFRLQARDVLDIAKISYNTNLFNNSLTWINGMNQTDNRDRAVLKEAEQVAVSTLFKHRHYQHAKERAQKVFRRYPEDKVLEATIKLMDQKLSESSPIPLDIVDTEMGRASEINMCSLPNITNFHTNSDTLGCLYKPGVLPYVRYKEELVSDSPKISLFYDVVTEREATFMKETATPLLEISTVEYDKRIISHDRVGKSSRLPDSLDPEIVTLSRRVQDITGLSTAAYDEDNQDADDFQVCNYGMAGQFDLHYDTAKAHQRRKDEEITAGAERRFRIATFMLYLSDVQLGGGTIFPKLHLYIPPVKYAAVFWHNLHRSGETDMKTLHAACPVLVGDKWIANKWMTEDPQMFRRPCGLNPEDQDPLFPQHTSR